jgi:hypothetical protein
MKMPAYYFKSNASKNRDKNQYKQKMKGLENFDSIIVTRFVITWKRKK